MNNTPGMADSLVAICQQAGEAILKVYHEADFEVETKADDSPVTKADIAASKVIEAGLQALWPQIPIVCEELPFPPFSQRQDWPRYWLIDPLDGTKEFIRRNDQFTVNIALIENHRAALGIVYVPVSNVAYLGFNDAAEDKQAYKIVDGEKRAIACRPLPAPGQELLVVASKHHRNQATDGFIAALERQWPQLSTRSIGSSLKFCLLAEGGADIYPRFAPTSEWDTAAAQAVLEAAGGRVFRSDHQALAYNTKESMLNPFFYAVADATHAWRDLLP